MFVKTIEADMTRILVVDDEENIRTLVTAYLQAEGYTVSEADDGQKAVDLFRRLRPDVVILDVMLPGMSGFDVLQQIRRESDVYVLMLTARSEETDRIVGLTVGADDYVTKPFSPREIVARVKAVLRRPRVGGGPADEGLLAFRHIRIDSRRFTVTRDEEPIDLTPLEFKLLKALAEHAGMVLSREQLLERVWGYDYYGEDRVVDVHIGRIRQKLEADPANPTFLVTVRGVGYRFEDEAL